MEKEKEMEEERKKFKSILEKFHSQACGKSYNYIYKYMQIYEKWTINTFFLAILFLFCSPHLSKNKKIEKNK